MTTTVPVLGGVATAFIPDNDTKMGLGYTGVRFYWSGTEAGPYSLAHTSTLVAGTLSYSYNKTDALVGDWFYWAPYGAVVGEGAASEPMPIGPSRATRKQIRQGVGLRLQLVDIVTVTSAASATDFTSNDLIDPDASNWKHANKWARVSSGAYAGAIRRVRAYSATDAAANGWAKATGKVIVGRTFGGTLSAADEVEMWLPRADEDPSVLIDQAMNRARNHMWAEQTYYLTTTAQVTDYFLPNDCREERITAVDFAADTYPDRPGWRPVPWWEVVMDNGAPRMTILATADAGSNRAYADSYIIRIKYNSFPDRMDSESDSWDFDLEWAVAETAMEYLRTQRGPLGNQGDVGDAELTFKDLQQESMDHRITWMPRIQPTERIAR